MKLFGSVNAVIAAVAVVALVAVGLVVAWPHTGTRTITADFPRTVSLYKGSQVKILGVRVGEVTDVQPEDTYVKVTMRYDAKDKVPADVKAALISPAIVGDRFIQLTPAYTGGATLPDHANLGVDRTATPLELDEIFGSLNDLDKALGPNGANADGSLSHLLTVTAKNFGGQGQQLNTTIKNVARLSKTLDDNKDELFGTAKDVETFINALAKNDTTVRQFSDSLASGSAMLADERTDLAAALKNLAVAMTQVRSFVQENKDALSSNIKGLTKISQTLVKRRDQLDEVLRVAPTALNNLALAYNGKAGTLDTRANLGEAVNQLTSDPKAVLCTLLGDSAAAQKACNALGGILNRTTPFSSADANRVTVSEPIDKTLGGLVGVTHE